MVNKMNINYISYNEMVDLYRTDEAFKYSVDNGDIINMQMVLRAHQYCFEYSEAESIIGHVLGVLSDS